MKLHPTFLILIMLVLAACSTTQSNIAQSTNTPIEIKANVNPPTETATFVATLPAAKATSTVKPPLAKDAWMQMPAVPTGISDSMRDVYQRGLEMGNDPKRFSVIGDCQNVSSYFLAVFEKPDEFSLGEEYAYLQPTIDYYQGSYSRQSLAVKG